jgi:hypothetical protein
MFLALNKVSFILLNLSEYSMINPSQAQSSSVAVQVLPDLY